MTLDERFADAAVRVKTLPAAPPPSTLLDLYGLYKQGSAGDATGKRPGMLDIRGRAKFDAWKKLAGTSQDAAKERYVGLVDKLLADS
jgi:diazepam-binding inhibitor (GABA receptor modulating acyl-CoA-binding protein)